MCFSSRREFLQLNLSLWLGPVTGQRKKGRSLICIPLSDITTALICTNYKSWSRHETGPSATARTNMKIASTGSRCSAREEPNLAISASPPPPTPLNQIHCRPRLPASPPDMKYSWERLQQQAAARTCCKWTPLNAVCNSYLQLQPLCSASHTHTHKQRWGCGADIRGVGRRREEIKSK